MRFVARVPATSANLGPGFDCLGLAVALRNEVAIETSEEFSIEIEGEGAGELPRERANLIVRSMEHVAASVSAALPDFSMHCLNRIPLERGLGSSSAAVVAGVVLADAILGVGLSDDRMLELAVRVEGHADNVAPALRGGLTLAYLSRDGWRAEALPLATDLRPVLLIPLSERMPTSEARRVLPGEVSREDAIFNVSRTALVVHALSGHEHLLREALEDRLHQSVRLPLVPGAYRVYGTLQEMGIPVCMSGAGPSLLAFESDDHIVPELGDEWVVLRVAPDLEGAEVSSAE